MPTGPQWLEIDLGPHGSHSVNHILIDFETVSVLYVQCVGVVDHMIQCIVYAHIPFALYVY